MADKEPKKQRGPGRPWPKGVSGNPTGCKTGSRHKATIAAQALLDGESEALTRKCVELALDGDLTALRLCLERIVPPRKDSPIRVELPPMESPADLPQVTGAILEAVAEGRLTPGEAETLGRVVEGHRRSLETADIETRLAALEAAKK